MKWILEGAEVHFSNLYFWIGIYTRLLLSSRRISQTKTLAAFSSSSRSHRRSSTHSSLFRIPATAKAPPASFLAPTSRCREELAPAALIFFRFWYAGDQPSTPASCISPLSGRLLPSGKPLPLVVRPCGLNCLYSHHHLLCCCHEGPNRLSSGDLLSSAGGHHHPSIIPVSPVSCYPSRCLG